MKKAGILNSDISRVLSYLGHTDTLCIGDCGLPIPDEVERIDLALCFGEPTFMRTLEIVAADMKIEKIVLAEEIKTQNPDVLSQIEKLFEGQNVEVVYVSHTQLKAQTHDCKAVIRTGETTPYANIICRQVVFLHKKQEQEEQAKLCKSKCVASTRRLVLTRS